MPLTVPEAAQQFVDDQVIHHAIVHGPASGAGSTVVTEGGTRPTLAKAVADLEESATASAAVAVAARDTALGYRNTAEDHMEDAEAALATATTRRDQAEAARDAAQGYRDTAEAHKNAAAASAATATAQAGTATAAVTALTGNTANRRMVRTAHIANVNIANPGTSTFGGLACTAGDRVLLAGQTTGSQNGIYDFNGSAVAMTRSVDSDSNVEMPPMLEVTISEGVFAKHSFLLTTAAPITLNTTALAFELAASAAKGPCVFANNSADQALTSTTFAVVALPDEVLDTHNAFASSAFTVPPGWAGKYFIHPRVQGASNSSLTVASVAIYKNGTIVPKTWDWETRSISGQAVVGHPCVLDLAEGDVITERSRCDGSSPYLYGTLNFNCSLFIMFLNK